MDQVPNTYPDLFWGYTVIWLLIALYVVWLSLRIARVEKKLKDRSLDSDR